MKTSTALLTSTATALLLATVLASPAFSQNSPTPPKRTGGGNPGSTPEIALEAAGGLAALLVGSFLLLQSRKRAHAR